MKLFINIGFLLLPVFICAQPRLFCKNAKITFISKAPLENIEARNNNVVTVLDLQSGQIEFSLLMKGFEFKKALMQEHFNENYVESDRYPKALFKGSFPVINTFPLQVDGVYPIIIDGTLTIHGVTQQINVPAVLTVSNNVLSGKAEFVVSPADYKIKIPSIVSDNISKKIIVQVHVPAYSPMGNK